jgi:hypothetical protein
MLSLINTFLSKVKKLSLLTNGLTIRMLKPIMIIVTKNISLKAEWDIVASTWDI